MQSEKCFLTCAYHSTSQSQEEFEIFCANSDILLSQINDEYPLSIQLLLEILMLVVQIGGKMTLLIQQVKK